jgi:tRNA A37 methylthiotransferase MiaB
MRRFGDRPRFLSLLGDIRRLAPEAGCRSNVIVGFPGERKADVAELSTFLEQARLDAVGVFGYSDEDGTEAAGLPGKVRRETIARRVERLTTLVEELTAQRAEERVGTVVDVLVETVDAGAGTAEGRAEHQAPEVDGTVTLRSRSGSVRDPFEVGQIVRGRVTAAVGVDLVAEPVDAA